MSRFVIVLLLCIAPQLGCQRGDPPEIARHQSNEPPAGEPVVIGSHVALRSETLQEDRSLLLYLPASYDASTFRYPVLYLLDATSDFLHTVGIVEFLSRTDRIPELIVVGIENTNRSRDLTPPSNDEGETAFWDQVGGADQFLQFVGDELIPFVDATYRTEPYRILRGQSFGGLLAIHDYMSTAPMFDAYISSSAAVGWNYGVLIDRAPAFFSREANAPLYLSAGGRDNPEVVKAISRFAESIERHAPPSLRWRFDLFEEEGHYSLVQLSTHNGLRYLYSDWQVPDDVAATADFSAYEEHFARLSRVLGYKVNIPMRTIIRLGNQLLRQQRFDEGIAVLESNIALYPQQPESYWHVGDGLMLSGRPDLARPFFQEALNKAVALGVSDLEHYRRPLDLTEQDNR